MFMFSSNEDDAPSIVNPILILLQFHSFITLNHSGHHDRNTFWRKNTIVILKNILLESMFKFSGEIARYLQDGLDFTMGWQGKVY